MSGERDVHGMSDAELEDYALNVMARDDYDPKALKVIDHDVCTCRRECCETHIDPGCILHGEDES